MSELRLWLLRLSMTRWMVFGEGILFDNMPDHASELGAGTIRCRRGEVPPGLWLHDAKYVRRAAPLVLIVLFGWLPRLGWDRRAHIGVQHDRLFVQANDRLGGIVRLFIDGQHILHLPDVLFIQFRDAPHFFPPRLQVVALQQNPDGLPPRFGD